MYCNIPKASSFVVLQICLQNAKIVKKTVIVDCFVYIFGASCTGIDIRRYHFLCSFISSQTVGQSIF